MKISDLKYLKEAIEWLQENTELREMNKANHETHCNIICDSLDILTENINKGNSADKNELKLELMSSDTNTLPVIKKARRPKKTADVLFNPMREIFMDGYKGCKGISYVGWDGVQAKATKFLIKKLRNLVMGDNPDGEVKVIYGNIVRNMKTLDNWIYINNFTPAMINSRLDTLISRINEINRKQVKNQNVDYDANDIMAEIKNQMGGE